MASAATRTLGKAAASRIGGSGPGPIRALVAAAIVGIGAGVVTYKALRSGS